MFKVTAYYWLKYHANKKILLGEVPQEYYFTYKQKQLSQTISIQTQLPFLWDQYSVVPLPVEDPKSVQSVYDKWKLL